MSNTEYIPISMHGYANVTFDNVPHRIPIQYPNENWYIETGSSLIIEHIWGHTNCFEFVGNVTILIFEPTESNAKGGAFRNVFIKNKNHLTINKPAVFEDAIITNVLEKSDDDPSLNLLDGVKGSISQFVFKLSKKTNSTYTFYTSSSNEINIERTTIVVTNRNYSYEANYKFLEGNYSIKFFERKPMKTPKPREEKSSKLPIIMVFATIGSVCLIGIYIFIIIKKFRMPSIDDISILDHSPIGG